MLKSKSVIADTNIFLRYLLRDVEGQYKKSKKLFERAKKSELEIVIRNEVVFEMCHVLEKFYEIDRENVAQKITTLLTTPYFEVEERDILLVSVEIYKNTKNDIIDCMLFTSAYLRDRDIVSFDKDIEKLRKTYM